MKRTLFRRFVAAAGVASLVALASIVPASAAIVAELSSPQGRAGDEIVLTTDDFHDQHAYEGLSTQSSQPIYMISASDYVRLLADFQKNVCGTTTQKALGRLTWKGDVGTLRFAIPEVAAGDYFFLMDVGAGVSSPPCWRIGGATGALTLAVGDQAAVQPSSVARPVSARDISTGALLGGGLAIAACLALSLYLLRPFWHKRS